MSDGGTYLPNSARLRDRRLIAKELVFWNVVFSPSQTRDDLIIDDLNGFLFQVGQVSTVGYEIQAQQEEENQQQRAPTESRKHSDVAVMVRRDKKERRQQLMSRKFSDT